MKTIQNIRNIGIMAHVDAGKTTATERMLYYSGFTHQLGNVDDGNTITDTDPQESKRGITISSAAVTTSWQVDGREYRVNIIDTPGHVDFTAEVERSLRVLDGAVGLFDAKSGVEPQSETVWRQADRYHVPRMAYINKMDRQGADFYRVVEEMRTELGANPAVLQLPIGSADEFEGVIDLVTMQALYWNQEDKGRTFTATEIPSDLMDDALQWREKLLDQVAFFDEHVLDAVIGGETVANEHVWAAVRQGTLQGEIVPVLTGAAFRNIGVQPILDAVARFLPSPSDLETVEGEHPETGEPEIRLVKPNAPVSALAFKVMADKYVGQMTMVRVYSGVLRPGEFVTNSRTGNRIRVSRILRIRANRFDPMEEAGPGEICALVGMKNVKTGDTLSAESHPIVLQSMDFPEPVIGYAIEAKENKDEKQLGVALSRLQHEDPTIAVFVDPQTGQTILRGMGELHLEVVLERLRQQYAVEVNQGAPMVAYKEELSHATEWTIKHEKQSGGSGHYAHISFEIGPRTDGGTGLEFVNDIKGGVIPREYIPSIRKGFEMAMANGVLAGYPVEAMRVRIVDGKTHVNDSSPQDFENAAKEGFREAAIHAGPRLLEPVMLVDIQTPDAYTGNVTGDLNRRRGLIVQMDMKGHLQTIKAEVPLSELFGYIMDLRGLSAGRASASLSFSRYAAVPRHVEEAVVA